MEEEQKEQMDVEKLNVESGNEELFKVSYATTSSKSEPQSPGNKNGEAEGEEEKRSDIFVPHARRSSYIQHHKGQLYLFGGKYEDLNDKEFTLCDMYSLNVKKLDEWKPIYEDKEFSDEVNKKTRMAESEDDDDEDEDDEDDEDEEEESDEEDEEDEEESEGPPVKEAESVQDYYARTSEHWLNLAKSDKENEQKSKKALTKISMELCFNFWNDSKK